MKNARAEIVIVIVLVLGIALSVLGLFGRRQASLPPPPRAVDSAVVEEAREIFAVLPAETKADICDGTWSDAVALAREVVDEPVAVAFANHAEDVCGWEYRR